MKSHSSLTYRLKVHLVQAAVLGSILGVWLYAQGPGGASPVVLPRFGDVVHEFRISLTDTEVYRAALITSTAIIVSFAIAAIGAFIVAFLAARTRIRAAVTEPILVAGYLVPSVLFYPLLILWFGTGISSKIAYGVMGGFFPIAFNALRALRGVDERYINVGRAFGASRAQLDWSIKVRAAVPMAAAGLRIGAATCVITVIVAEMLSSRDGLGYRLRAFAQSFAPAKTYATIMVILILVGMFLFLTNRLLPKPIETGGKDR